MSLNKENYLKQKKRGTILLILYLLAVVWIILFKFSLSISDFISLVDSQIRNIYLIPFKESVISNGTIDLSKLIDNIVIFIPLGGLLGIVSKNTGVIKKVGYIFLFSLGLEVYQYIFGVGATDIVPNGTGGFLGLIIYTFLRKIR